MTPAILVPVKEPGIAKSRLSSLMTAAERSQFAWAMLQDLIRVVQPLPWPVVFVTNSHRVAAHAGKLGYRVLLEAEQTSESASIDAASGLLKSEGVEAVLRLPADIPMAQSCDVVELVSQAAAAPCAVMAPSQDRMGTNALLRVPPDVFPSRFGHNSFVLHLREAAAAVAQVRVVENARLALDLDDPSDIARFIAQPVEGETYRTLMHFNVSQRLSRHALQ